MKHLRSATALAMVLILFSTLQAWARAQYVLDGASLFSSATVERLNEELTSFNARTGKEVLVVSVPSLDGKTLQQASEDEFAHEQVNGVMIYLAKAEHQDAVIGDRASAAFFPSGSFDGIRQAMRGYFRDGDFDTGIQTGVSLVLNQYMGHRRTRYAPNGGMVSYGQPTTRSAGGMGMLWTILILVAGFLIVRALLRALMGPRMMPPQYGPGPGPGGFGFGGPGYGGYGPGGGGGSFFSGLLGGLGGAWLGNELFGNHGNQNIGGMPMDQQAGLGGGNWADNSGWQNDAGQADIGNASFGSFGDQGGGFGGDPGGGFGGGDNSGGGW